MLPQRLPYEQMQVKWAQELNPIIANQLLNGVLLSNVKINNGVTVINHLLGRKQIGYFITDINGPATIYRSADLNGLTLQLTSNAACTVSLWCF